MKYTKQNRKKLAWIVANNMDVDSLLDVVAELLENDYRQDEGLFHEEAEAFSALD